MILSASELYYLRNENFVLETDPLVFEPGVISAIVGPNGAGKTTFLKLLAGSLRPDSGEIFLNGVPRARFSTRKWAQNIAFVAQDSAGRPEFSVRQYLELGRLPFRRPFRSLTALDLESIDQAAELCGLEYIYHKPLQELSGGEFQRAGIARGVAQDPNVLILDEPTNHLDLKAVQEVVELLDSLARNKSLALVMTCHDLDLVASVAPRVSVLSEGKMRVTGATNEVLSPELIKRYWDAEVHEVDIANRRRLVLRHSDALTTPTESY